MAPLRCGTPIVALNYLPLKWMAVGFAGPQLFRPTDGGLSPAVKTTRPGCGRPQPLNRSPPGSKDDEGSANRLPARYHTPMNSSPNVVIGRRHFAGIFLLCF